LDVAYARDRLILVVSEILRQRLKGPAGANHWLPEGGGGGGKPVESPLVKFLVTKWVVTIPVEQNGLEGERPGTIVGLSWVVEVTAQVNLYPRGHTDKY